MLGELKAETFFTCISKYAENARHSSGFSA